MSEAALRPPDPGEYSPYYQSYIARVPAGDVLDILSRQVEDTVKLLRGATAKGEHRYAPGKWSVKEVIGHVIDSERVFAYRALRFSRGDPTPLPGFEQDDWVRRGGFGGRTLVGLLEELGHVRRATVSLFEGCDDVMLVRRGVANGVAFTVRALAYIIAGHERHHLAVLKERYF